MKVLFTFPGLAHYLQAQLRKLSQKGIDVAAIVPFKNSSSMGAGVHLEEQAQGFKLIEGKEKKSFLGKPIFYNLPEILEQEKPDILVIGWPYALDLLFNSNLKKAIRKHHVKLIYKGIPFNLPARSNLYSYYWKGQFTGDDSQQSPQKSIIGYLKFLAITLLRGFYLRKVDAHVYYIDEAKEIASSYGVASEKIFITYNSPDTEQHLQVYHKIQSLPALLPAGKIRLIHVGRLVYWKRVDLLIEAYRKLLPKYPNLEVLIVGAGPEEQNLRTLANNDPNIRFTGAVYDPELLGRYFVESTIYVLAGMGGLSINEAMCYAKPILCTRADGTEKTMVREGKNGYFFENANLSDLVKKLELMLESPEKCNAMGNESLRIIEEEINLESVASRYVRAFEFVTANVHAKI
jgi:glycosyltransferase involved in cell wall biosynthesis